MNDRVEQSHQPTRLRECQVRRFESTLSSRRFVAASSRFYNCFRPRRHLLAAAEYRNVRRTPYAGRRELTSAA